MEPLNRRLLGIYLNDHLAGAAVGIDLARRCRSRHGDAPLGRALDELIAEIREDRATLEQVMAALRIPGDRLKLVAGSVGEKLSRLKLNGQLLGYSALSRLEELEGLHAGVTAKQRMWISLDEIAASEPRLSGFDFRALADRAQRQLDVLEQYRRDAAKLALAG